MLDLIRKRLFGRTPGPRVEVLPAEGYDLWSATYDNQPENVVMHLEGQVFEDLIGDVTFRGKTVIDVGCGTGRHWAKMLDGAPERLIGYDVSSGMLARLREKYPQAVVHRLKHHELTDTANEECDVLVSTLALGYMPNLEATIGEWRRVLMRDGRVLISDFHPRAAATSNRNFRHEGRIVNIRHYVHSLAYLRTTAARAGLEEVRFVEKVVDDSVRRFYESNDALNVFNQSKGVPLVYGILLKSVLRSG